MFQVYFVASRVISCYIVYYSSGGRALCIAGMEFLGKGAPASLLLWIFLARVRVRVLRIWRRFCRAPVTMMLRCFTRVFSENLSEGESADCVLSQYVESSACSARKWYRLRSLRRVSSA